LLSRQRLNKSDLLAAGGYRKLIFPHQPGPAHNGADRPAHDLDPIVGRPASPRGHPFIADGLPTLEVHNSEIGVVADCDTALLRDTEQTGRTGAREID